MNWNEIAAVGTGRTRLERICWPYDYYPEMPQLTAGTSIVLLDADGPGVVTNLHSSRMDFLADVLGGSGPREADAYRRVLIEITYDRRPTPDIRMPLCDFLGDVDGACDYYSTVYLSKVRFSHNFRLPIPFREHITIRLVNTTATDLIGYTDLQWEQVDALPAEVGYLYAACAGGSMTIPEETAELCRIPGSGTVRAHWFAVGTDLPLAADGEYVCEGNQSFFVGDEQTPSLEYLGTEDVYSHSWGFAGTGGDGYAAIIRMEHPRPQRTEIAMLRCRTHDAVHFSGGLRVLLDYRQEYFATGSVNPLHRQGVFADRERVSCPIDWKSCFYYYRVD